MVPVVKSPSSNAGGRCGFNPLSGSYDPTCDGAKNQNIKQKGYCNNFNKGFKKMFHIKKKKKKNNLKNPRDFTSAAACLCEPVCIYVYTHVCSWPVHCISSGGCFPESLLFSSG